MKIEVIWAQSIKYGISKATSLYGEDAVLLSHSKIGKKYRLIIGVSKAAVKNPSKCTSNFIASMKPTQVREKVDYEVISRMIKKELESLKAVATNEAEKSSRNAGRGSEFLDKAGVPANMQSLFIDEENKTISLEGIIKLVREKLFQILPGSIDLDRSVKTHVLCGNFGSGKSTVAIKMALKFMTLCDVPPILVSYKQSLTSSALMKELSESFNLPIFEISDVETLKMVEHQLVGDSILIVDTSASNVFDDISEIETNLNSVNFHLVNASDSFAASQEYLIGAAKWSSVIITRLEMIPSRWPLIESLVNSQVPLSLGSVSPDIDSELVCVSKTDLINQLSQNFQTALDAMRCNVPERKVA